MTTSPARASLDVLTSALVGRVVTPDDDGWDAARRAWNVARDQRPDAVVLAASPADVSTAVKFARANGLRVAAQGTGHGATALGSLEGALLVKTAGMRGVSLDVEARRARVEAGAEWADVTGPAGEHGLAALAGSSPDVGVAGYTLGGGVSWLSRRYGLAANAVTAVEVVTVDGEVVRADAEHHPDLFWALRGGGGSFGVVTALEFELFPVANVHAGALFFPLQAANDVLPAWSDWTATLPDDITSCARMLRLPPLPDIPEPLRGNAFTVVEVASCGEPRELDDLLAPLRALGPSIDTIDTIPAAGLGRLHMDPEGPVPFTGDGMLLTALPSAATEAAVTVAGASSQSVLLSVEFRHLGGALCRPARNGGVLPAFDAGYLMYAVGIAAAPEMAVAADRDIDALRAALDPWAAAHHYVNFCETDAPASTLFPAAALDRLAEVKRRYDPTNIFMSNHPIGAAD